MRDCFISGARGVEIAMTIVYKRKCFLLAVLPSVLLPLFGQAKHIALPSRTEKSESTGEALFKEDKGEQAIAPLEREIAAGDESIDKYNFLGLAYYQAGDYKKSIQSFERGMKAAGEESAAKWALSYNAGNSAFADGNFAAAEGYYSDAYRMNSEFSAALLNRANARLNQDKLVEARDDYALYLERCPNSPQQERINALLSLLDEEIKKHAILPEKLEAAVALLPQAAAVLSLDEAVDDIYKDDMPLPPAVSEAMEKEAALLQSQTPVMPVSEGMEKEAALLQNTAPAVLNAEGMEREAAILRNNDNALPSAEEMEEGIATPPPLPRSKSIDTGEEITKDSRLPNTLDAVEAKQAAKDALKEQSEEMDDSEAVAPPPVRKKHNNSSEETLESTDVTAPPPAKKRIKDSGSEQWTGE